MELERWIDQASVAKSKYRNRVELACHAIGQRYTNQQMDMEQQRRQLQQEIDLLEGQKHERIAALEAKSIFWMESVARSLDNAHEQIQELRSLLQQQQQQQQQQPPPSLSPSLPTTTNARITGGHWKNHVVPSAPFEEELQNEEQSPTKPKPGSLAAMLPEDDVDKEQQNEEEQEPEQVEEEEEEEDAQAAASDLLLLPSPPPELFCPITLELMVDPVLAADGHTYERSAMEHLFSELAPGNPPRSPKTGELLAFDILLPNVAIRSMCREYQEQQQLLQRKASV